MYKGFYFGVIISALIGLLLSYLVIPGREEVALMNMQDKYFENAFERYKQLLEEGDSSVRVVMPLARLYLQYGDIHSAITIMEKFIEKHPNAIEARKQLGTFYKYAQQPDDYTKNLEEIYKRAPSTEILRELSDIYNFTAEYEKQIIILEELLKDKRYNAIESDYVSLAYLYGSHKHFNKAIETMLRLTKNQDIPVSIESMELAVSLMIDADQIDMALQVAQDYVSHFETTQEVARLAQNFRYKQRPDLAYEILEPFIDSTEQGPKILTETILLQLILNKDKPKKHYEHNVEKLLTKLYQRNDVKAKDKREIAYTLLDSDFKQEAINLFFHLAEKASPFSPDVEQLIYLWGEKNIGEANVEWLERRALDSTGHEQDKWFKYLVDTNNPTAIIKIVEQAGDMNISKGAMDAYLDALVLTRNKAKLSQLIRREINRESDVQRLKKLALFALYEDLSDVAESVFRDILTITPNDSEVIQHLGEITFYKGKFSESEKLLSRYLENNKGSYQINYFYGEILWRNKQYKQAKIYYKRSLSLLQKIKNKDFQALMIEANLLFRYNDTQKAISRFRKLLKQHPKDKNLRSDFATILMEMGKYDEASKVLSGS